jgi:hypothetical protein
MLGFGLLYCSYRKNIFSIENLQNFVNTILTTHTIHITDDEARLRAKGTVSVSATTFTPFKGRVHLRYDLRHDLRFDLRFSACVGTPMQEIPLSWCVTRQLAGTELQVESQVITQVITQVDTMPLKAQ